MERVPTAWWAPPAGVGRGHSEASTLGRDSDSLSVTGGHYSVAMTYPLGNIFTISPKERMPAFLLRLHVCYDSGSPGVSSLTVTYLPANAREVQGWLFLEAQKARGVHRGCRAAQWGGTCRGKGGWPCSRVSSSTGNHGSCGSHRRVHSGPNGPLWCLRSDRGGRSR